MKRSVHDNFVLGYSVDAEAASILLRTEYRDQGEPFEKTNVRFDGVIGYKFRDNLGSILFDIEEDSFDRILEEHAGDFAWGTRYGWPWLSASADEDPAEFVRANGATVFRIQSSIGFDGFVISKTMSIEAG